MSDAAQVHISKISQNGFFFLGKVLKMFLNVMKYFYFFITLIYTRKILSLSDNNQKHCNNYIYIFRNTSIPQILLLQTKILIYPTIEHLQENKIKYFGH